MAIKRTMLVTDTGFAVYWILTATGLLTVGPDRFLHQWNWSFIGLDLLAIGLGLASFAVSRRASALSDRLMVISLALTSAAGLMALNFYIVRCEFDLSWWLPNLWLTVFPLAALALLPLRPPGLPGGALEN